MVPVPSTRHSLLRYPSSDTAIQTPGWETGSDPLGDWKDAHVVLRDRREKRRCRGALSLKKDAGRGAAECPGSGIAMKTLDEMGGEAQRHSRAAEVKSPWVETRGRSEDFARWMTSRRQAVFVGGMGVAVAAAELAVVHCWDRTGGSCSVSRRVRTDAAESGTGRCMAEGPS